MDQKHLDAVILGAGIAGLTVATRLKQAGMNVLLLEKSARAGGAIRSEKKNGFLLEIGPNTVLPNADLAFLIKDAGLLDQMILANAKISRYILRRGRLCPVPMSPGALLTTPLMSLSGKLRLLFEPFVRSPRKDGDENLISFAQRRLGKEAATRLLAPYVSGVWAGDALQLSAEGTFPKLVEWERKHGSLFMGMIKSRGEKTKNTPQQVKGLLSFKEGLETLPRALGSQLGDNIRYNARVRHITPERWDGGHISWQIELEDSTLRASRLVVALSAPEAVNLTRSFDSELSESLQSIPYAPIAVVHLGYQKNQVANPLRGFGYLTLPHERNNILGCLWNSSLFQNRAPEGTSLLTVFIGGALSKDLVEQNDQSLLDLAHGEVQKTLRITGQPIFTSLVRYIEAIPQYTLGHKKRVAKITEAEARFPGLTFTGNYLEGISVGDVVAHAMKKTQEILEETKFKSEFPFSNDRIPSVKS